jgi:holo-[acyl-carrier protein] synthase
MTESIRVGIDLCSAREVERSIAQFGDRYLGRVYTDREIEYCEREPAMRAERFAARFAAKEAVIKVLRPTAARPEWKAIEIVRRPEGWCEIELSGTAAQHAVDAAVATFSVSMSHEGDMASAVVVATIAEERTKDWKD